MNTKPKVFKKIVQSINNLPEACLPHIVNSTSVPIGGGQADDEMSAAPVQVLICNTSCFSWILDHTSQWKYMPACTSQMYQQWLQLCLWLFYCLSRDKSQCNSNTSEIFWHLWNHHNVTPVTFTQSPVHSYSLCVKFCYFVKPVSV